MIGKTLGRYRIVEKIGEGGMGVVYRARDERLQRDVALKVLPSGKLTDEDSRSRFQREAQALARLSHSHIGAVHDFDTQEDVDFLVMEYIPGVTLSKRLASGALPENEIFHYGQQLAEGLLTAHEKGVVHRDLKPANLRITPEGELKILDFGLAKLLQSAPESDLAQSLTETGQLAGTVPYMAPEQLRGEPVDARTDIYALGAVFYEMATGSRPFPEEIAPRLTDAILHQSPLAPRQRNPQVSLGLEQVILKCLEKAPEDRYQSAGEVVTDLGRLSAGETTIVLPKPERRRRWRWLAIAALVLFGLLGTLVYLRIRPAEVSLPTGGIDSLAVLPLKNLSGDPAQEFFADGITEALIDDLGKIGSLKVISRTSVMQYKDTNKRLPEIARELDVDAVVEGSVQRAGERVQIRVRLFDPDTDTLLWAETYRRDLGDILALQNEIARAIAQRIQVELTAQEEARLRAARAVNPEAHLAYLEGRYHFNQYSLEGFTKARECFELALEKDPDYAPAYAALSPAYGALAYWGYRPPREVLPKGKAVALRAIELDDTLGEAHGNMAMFRWCVDWDWPAAEKEFKRAIELNPNDAFVRLNYAFFLASAARPDEGMAQISRACELDPLNPVYEAALGTHLDFAHRYDEAIERLQKVLEAVPNFFPAQHRLWMAYRHKGLYDQAFREAKKAFSLRPNGDKVVQAMELGYAQSGYRGAMRLAAETLVAQSKERYVKPATIAARYADAEEKQLALEWLEKAYDECDPALIHLPVEPAWGGLRSEPRFQDLLRRMNVPAGISQDRR
ncbi:MAG: protein kinase domain-containing protein [Planctomycetota bacterium]|jgi:serine/threonine-protein kinase